VILIQENQCSNPYNVPPFLLLLDFLLCFLMSCKILKCSYYFLNKFMSNMLVVFLIVPARRQFPSCRLAKLCQVQLQPFQVTNDISENVLRAGLLKLAQ
jgi:hypothetical protein